MKNIAENRPEVQDAAYLMCERLQAYITRGVCVGVVNNLFTKKNCVLNSVEINEIRLVMNINLLSRPSPRKL